MTRRSKYGNRATVVDGIKFASKREAKRYRELQLMQLAGEICELERQVRFPLTCNGKPLLYKSGRQASYICDFKYIDASSSEVVIEDSKGFRDRVFLLKRAIMNTMGYRILET